MASIIGRVFYILFIRNKTSEVWTKTHSEILNQLVLAHFSSLFKNNFQAKRRKGQNNKITFVVSHSLHLPCLRLGAPGFLRWVLCGGVGEHKKKTAWGHRLEGSFPWALLDYFTTLRVKESVGAWVLYIGKTHRINSVVPLEVSFTLS